MVYLAPEEFFENMLLVYIFVDMCGVEGKLWTL